MILQNKKARERHLNVFKLRQEGKTLPEIAQKLGVSKQRIYFMLKKYREYLSVSQHPTNETQ